ncbi:hypothetical protein H311_00051 [Anncaliia algerae PRA109]|nr:hypothetical protein H311_00051 [Anncaliia algerae PRA109]
MHLMSCTFSILSLHVRINIYRIKINYLEAKKLSFLKLYPEIVNAVFIFNGCNSTYEFFYVSTVSNCGLINNMFNKLKDKIMFNIENKYIIFTL